MITHEQLIERRHEKIKRYGLDGEAKFQKDEMSRHVKEVSDRFKRKDRTELHLSEWRQDRYYLRDGFLDKWI